MTRVIGLLVTLGVLAAAVFLVPASAMTTPKLVGTVGPGYTITLKKGTKKVTTLKAGKYTFVVTDKAPIHNFTLERETGGKFEKVLTATAFQGKKTVTLALKTGKWKYYCSVHEPQMFGFIRVTS
jgi:plastocyanin